MADENRATFLIAKCINYLKILPHSHLLGNPGSSLCQMEVESLNLLYQAHIPILLVVKHSANWKLRCPELARFCWSFLQIASGLCL